MDAKIHLFRRSMVYWWLNVEETNELALELRLFALSQWHMPLRLRDDAVQQRFTYRTHPTRAHSDVKPLTSSINIFMNTPTMWFWRAALKWQIYSLFIYDPWCSWIEFHVFWQAIRNREEYTLSSLNKNISIYLCVYILIYTILVY